MLLDRAANVSAIFDRLTGSKVVLLFYDDRAIY